MDKQRTGCPCGHVAKDGEWHPYDLHDPATISFLIPEEQREAWMNDYANMRRFFIYGESPEFDALMQRMEELQARVRKISYKGSSIEK